MNISELIIPRTKGRLSTSIQLRAGIDVDSLAPILATIDPKLAAAVQSYSGITTLNAQYGPGGSSNVIGQAGALATPGTNYSDIDGVQSFSRDQHREYVARYSLGQNSFEPFQIVPGQITTELVLKRIVFYDVTSPTLLNVFGFFPETLMFQMFPFVLMEEKYAPDEGSFTQAEDTVGSSLQDSPVYLPQSKPKLVAVNLYMECWFIGNPVNYDITQGNLLVIPEMKIRCGRMVSFDGTQQSNFVVNAEGVGALANGLANTIPLITNKFSGLDLTGTAKTLNSQAVSAVSGALSTLPKL